jgi:CoA:oxalate CoA-transferase
MRKKALAGVRVLEYAHLAAGPYCGKLLADLGAEVIKIEEPKTGDDARRRGPFLHDIPHPERSAFFLNLNTNKLGITLNLKIATGMDIFKSLVEDVDILIEDKSPQMMREMGISFEILQKVNPRLVMTSITPFGQTGPYAEYKAYPLNTFHSGVLGYLTPARFPNLDREPLKLGGMFGEYSCGLMAASGTLAALYNQRITGLGQHVDSSKQEAIIDLNRILATQYPNTRACDTRSTSMIGGVSELVPCKDGYVVLAIAEDHHWNALVRFMGNPEWAKNNICENNGERMAHRLEIRSHLMEWAKDHTKEELYHQGQAANCPITPVMSAEEIVNAEQLKARGFFVEATNQMRDEIRYPGAPFKLSETPWAIEISAPSLGQHNELIYCERKGYTKQDLVKMKQAGII